MSTEDDFISVVALVNEDMRQIAGVEVRLGSDRFILHEDDARALQGQLSVALDRARQRISRDP